MPNADYPDFLFLLASASAAAAEDDATIYRSVLKGIVSHEKPERYAVASQTISAPVMLTPRVPRHAPENQFLDSLRGLPARLQKQLLSEENASPLMFDPAVAFLGREALLRADSKLTAIGFSKIAYDGQRNALLYAEVCQAGADPVCGGEGYWFVQSAGHWMLRKHAYLWQGSAQPFWH